MPVIERTFSTLEEVERWVAKKKPTSHPSSIRLIMEDPTTKDPADEFIENIDSIAVDMGPPDLAEQHDHYLYGIPKHK
ncbi:hypothetical protein [Candidatus Thiosymbion oneisti]|uniref:hypothetical protein n=1 Tax=Candidatus Thiosymbion oneisti TaxID=589554 RepID=UPI000AB9C23A|nr:hypothetical protein [Candidatus Thiosymbion oneisti]